MKEIYTSDNPKVDLEKLDTTDIPVLLRILRNTHRHYLEASIVSLVLTAQQIWMLNS